MILSLMRQKLPKKSIQKPLNTKMKNTATVFSSVFVANGLLDELPDVFSKVIGRDKNGNYNINYIKLSLFFVETMTRTDTKE